MEFKNFKNETTECVISLFAINLPKDVSKTTTPVMAQDVIIEIKTIVNGTPYLNYSSIQAYGDKVQQLNGMKRGDVVNVEFSPSGRLSVSDKITPSEGNPLSNSVINNFNLVKIARYGVVLPVVASAPVNRTPNGAVIPEGFIYDEATKSIKEDFPF